MTRSTLNVAIVYLIIITLIKIEVWIIKPLTGINVKLVKAY